MFVLKRKIKKKDCISEFLLEGVLGRLIHKDSPKKEVAESHFLLKKLKNSENLYSQMKALEDVEKVTFLLEDSRCS